MARMKIYPKWARESEAGKFRMAHEARMVATGKIKQKSKPKPKAKPKKDVTQRGRRKNRVLRDDATYQRDMQELKQRFLDGRSNGKMDPYYDDTVYRALATCRSFHMDLDDFVDVRYTKYGWQFEVVIGIPKHYYPNQPEEVQRIIDLIIKHAFVSDEYGEGSDELYDETGYRYLKGWVDLEFYAYEGGSGMYDPDDLTKAAYRQICRHNTSKHFFSTDGYEDRMDDLMVIHSLPSLKKEKPWWCQHTPRQPVHDYPKARTFHNLTKTDKSNIAESRKAEMLRKLGF